MKNKYLDLILAVALSIVAASAFSYTWTPLSSSSFAGVMAMSADGRVICSCPSTGGQLRISRDRGQTWSIATNTPPSGSLSANPVALTADGSQIIACLSSNFGPQTGVFLSSDFGTNWTKTSLPVLFSFGSYGVACSASGSNMLAAQSGGLVYFSTNSGINWSTSTAPSTNWISLACSANAACILGAVNGGNLYVSTNFGADWAPMNLPVQAWKSVCISADGKTMGATGASTYISQNAGATWITNAFTGNNIACSADGGIWMLSKAQIYTSNDGGATWTTNLATAGWGGAMSADGCAIVAEQILGSGGLTNWIGRITPSPQVNIQTIDGNQNLSWLLPSTNFVLQQTADVTSGNWAPVSGNPMLNFTNLQQQVTVPSTGSNVFFRLSAQ